MNSIHRITAAAFLAAIGLQSLHADTFIVGGVEFTTNGETSVSASKHIEGTDISIPAKVSDPATGKEYDVTEISGRAFLEAALDSVAIPASVKTIGEYCFSKSTVVKVSIEEGIDSIGFGCFNRCRNLKHVNIPSTVRVLGGADSYFGFEGMAFNECFALESIEIPGSVERIPEQTFVSCTNLKNVKLGEGIKSIGESAFDQCISLRRITIPESLEEMGRGAFMRTGLENPVIPGSLKVIPNSAFLWCQKMTGFTIEEGIVEVGKQSFAACYGFTKIEVPNSVEWIRTDAFQANDNVTEIHIGSGIRRLGHASLAVWGPDEKTNTPHWKLKEIHIDSPVPPVHEQNDDHFEIVDDDFFFGAKEFTETLRRKFYAEVKLYVPEEAVDAYRNADIWKNFVFINDNVNDDKGIDDVESGRKLSVADGIATFDGPMEIYAASGVRTSAAGYFDLNSLGAGIYIVRAGGQTVKTAVR